MIDAQHAAMVGRTRRIRPRPGCRPTHTPRPPSTAQSLRRAFRRLRWNNGLRSKARLPPERENPVALSRLEGGGAAVADGGEADPHLVSFQFVDPRRGLTPGTADGTE